MSNISFLTLEDVNGAIYENQTHWWHCVNLTLLNQSNNNFNDVKVDFCNISRTNGQYYIDVEHPLWTMAYYVLVNGQGVSASKVLWVENQIVISNTAFGVGDEIKLFLYMGIEKYSEFTRMGYAPREEVFHFNLKELQTRQNIDVVSVTGTYYTSVYQYLEEGFNHILYQGADFGFVLVKLLKTDFQFDCTQSLTLGKVNTVKLGTLTDYKPNGSLVGSYTPTITVLYGSTYIPVRFDSSLNDYVFDIDLTNKETEGKLRLKVFVEANDVLNATETDIALNTSFENINNESKLTTLFKNGGIGRIGNNITLTKDITVENSVLLLGNAKTINMANHKFIVPSEKTFKTENTIFTNGKNTIQQNIGSTVELTSCGFSNCTGFGSVIDCQTDLSSLSVENDFITNITNCVFNNNDMCILHGGELNITDCEITGKISNPNNPYFLYQTDGEATILQSTFNLSSDTQIEEDIEFNSCIFTCGESAIINGDSHDELQRNDITSFISNPQNNTSKINVTYYYPAIEDYITLESNNGYCHSCSNVDYVFKNNVTVRRD